MSEKGAWRMTLRASCIGFLVLVLASASASADGGIGSGSGAPNAKVMQTWESKLRAIDQMLEEGMHDDAYHDAHALLHEMCSRIVSGKGALPLMALASTFRAVAEAGRGHEARALWDFHTARAFIPDLDNVDLSKYGDAGALLTRLLAATVRAEPADASFPTGEEIKESKKAQREERRRKKQEARARGERFREPDKVQPPVRVISKPPEYPAGLRGACIQGRVLIDSVIGEDGIPRTPQIIASDGGPVMAYAALESARQWRFRPAKKHGEPLAVPFKLAVNFELPRCSRGN